MMYLEADLNLSESWSEQDGVVVAVLEGGEKWRGKSVGTEAVRISKSKKKYSHSKIGREKVLLLSVSVK